VRGAQGDVLVEPVDCAGVVSRKRLLARDLAQTASARTLAVIAGVLATGSRQRPLPQLACTVRSRSPARTRARFSALKKASRGTVPARALR
jgi:hypothetical protein